MQKIGIHFIFAKESEEISLEESISEAKQLIIHYIDSI